jgi:hypothetical protein
VSVEVTHERVYDKLVATARGRQLVTYTDLGKAADLDVSDRQQLDQLVKILDKIAIADLRANRPLLVTVVIRADRGTPSKGFFDFAKQHGLMKRQDEVGFFSQELARVYDAWKEPGANVAPS